MSDEGASRRRDLTHAPVASAYACVMLDPNRVQTSDLLISFTLDDDGNPVCDDMVQLDTDTERDELPAPEL